MSTTHISVVHQVVVQQSKVVVGLQSEGLRHNAQWIVFIEIVRQHGEYWTYTFSADRQYVLNGVVQRGRLAIVNQIIEGLIHFLQ